MLIKKPADLKYSDITPKHIYLNRPRLNQRLNRRRLLGASAEDRLDGSGLLGQGHRIATTMFNGYGNQVAGLYKGMDLIKNY